MINPVEVTSDLKLKQALELHNNILAIVASKNLDYNTTLSDTDIQALMQELFELVSDAFDPSTMAPDSVYFDQIVKTVGTQNWGCGISIDEYLNYAKRILEWPPTLSAAVVAIGLVRSLFLKDVNTNIGYVRPGIDALEYDESIKKTVPKNGWTKFFNAFHNVILAA